MKSSEYLQLPILRIELVPTHANLGVKRIIDRAQNPS